MYILFSFNFVISLSKLKFPCTLVWMIILTCLSSCKDIELSVSEVMSAGKMYVFLRKMFRNASICKDILEGYFIKTRNNIKAFKKDPINSNCLYFKAAWWGHDINKHPDYIQQENSSRFKRFKYKKQYILLSRVKIQT